MRALTLLAVASVASAAFAFPYSTSFESPFTPGALDLQQGWESTDTVQSYTIANVGAGARTGSQVVRFEDKAGTAPWATRQLPGSTTFVIAAVSVFIPTTTSSDYVFGLDAFFDVLSLDQATISFDSSGRIFGTQSSAGISQIGTLTGAATNRWVDLRLTLNLTSNTAVGFIDGQSFNLANVGTAAAISSVDLFSFDRGTNVGGVAWYDDYAAVPEPMTMTVLAAGLALAARRRRKA